ncbi:uncharacterized protein ColSpa_04544 [Colletotrichum spaethianum]|uniref:Uncharacterized protein n=1 Tax=Colletotrichum spaethianum TaxID=700344 RepID=A0AA37P125_9PEZI|nr:uncharacterized protein ColSpa_04544 [Colletotrichum spaethianum]GKT44363.1 hypothetical protein ColSpa_04544 [Colletotrichum spaethianum]
MLSWAIKPWTVRWDGADRPNGNGTLLAQHYGGVDDWSKHYDWMAPLSNTLTISEVNGKVQMMIYNPYHMGDMGKRMFDA